MHEKHIIKGPKQDFVIVGGFTFIHLAEIDEEIQNPWHTSAKTR